MLKSSGDHAWPWANAGDQAEEAFSRAYHSLHAHMKPLEESLKRRQDQGRYWWELRACAYWDEFEQPKVIYQDITWTPSFCLDIINTYTNNTVYFLPTSDPWVLAVLNSPAGWWFAWRKAQHGKDEALRFFTVFMEQFPIPVPSAEQREFYESDVNRLVELTETHQETVRNLLDWLKVEHEIAKPTNRLRDPIALDTDALVAEVRKIRGSKKPLSLAALRGLRDEHARTIVPAQALAAEARGLELRVSDLVNDAYGLTPEEVRLMWETAPPRMPIDPPSPLPTEAAP